MRAKLSVHFQGEEGIDAGGVSREWYQVGPPLFRVQIPIELSNICGPVRMHVPPDMCPMRPNGTDHTAPFDHNVPSMLHALFISLSAGVCGMPVIAAGARCR